MSRIAHIMLCSPFHAGLGYQENLLTAKQRQLGYDVFVISYNPDNFSYREFTDENGTVVIQLKKNGSVLAKIPFIKKCINRVTDLLNTVISIDPTYIFVHQTYARDYLQLKKFKKSHPNVKIYADNHDDYYNSSLITIKDICYRRIVCRAISRNFTSICEKVWGVSPWRMKYLIDVYGVEKEKVSLLVMGGDDFLINKAIIDNAGKYIREKYSIPDDSFCIISGGKLDKSKNIHLLVDAINKMDKQDIFLILFGSIEKDILEYIENAHLPNVVNIGWIPSNNVYPLFVAADLGVFPGTHSVLWEQACASGLPCIFKDWEGGFNHLDCGGNCVMMKDEITKESLAYEILKIKTDKGLYGNMKSVASLLAMPKFAYSQIAMQSIGVQKSDMDIVHYSSKTDDAKKGPCIL